MGHQLLGVRAGWELFGLGPGQVVRVQLARARVTRTAFPGLLSSGPVTLLAGPHQVIVRPLDNVPGYLIPDGRAVRPLRGALSSGGVVLPGPRPGGFWMESGDGAHMSMLLVGPGGNRLGPAVPTPMSNGWPCADGREVPDGATERRGLRPGSGLAPPSIAATGVLRFCDGGETPGHGLYASGLVESYRGRGPGKRRPYVFLRPQ